MPFLALFLRVAPLQKEIPNAAQTPGGASLYKALLHALAPNDEALDELFHQDGASTHITVYPLKSDEGEQRVRVTVSGQHALTATHTLLSALAGQAVLHCGHQSYRVLSADLLAPSLSSRPALRLRFVTPAIFTGTAEGSVQGEVFPQPLQVFSGLLDRWSQLGGPALPCGVLSWLQSYECIVSDYRLRAEPIALSGRAESATVYPGWKGWIAYTCRAPQVAYMSTLQALARLAWFTGVGDSTEVGLGVTQSVESE
jgi:CRISPR-associated endoribonuclease Cas6